jgi:hypothetical protein
MLLRAETTAFCEFDIFIFYSSFAGKGFLLQSALLIFPNQLKKINSTLKL